MTTLISIDNGGTLTDAIAVREGQFFRSKALTTPHDLSKCFVDSITALSIEIFGEPALDRLLGETEIIRYSTTQGTNALVQAREKGPRLGILLDSNSDISELQTTDEEKALFDSLITDRVSNLELHADDEEFGHEVIRSVNELLVKGVNRLVVSFSGDDFAEKEKRFRKVVLHKFPRHFLGALPILLSHEMASDSNICRRSWTSILNTFLHPAMEHFLYNAENLLRESKVKNPLMIFRNDGNSSRVAKTIALKTYSSGPRGGMEGAKVYARINKFPRVVTMDIGGTTTDIGIAQPDSIREMEYGKIEGVEVAFPLCDVISAGVGGSSVLKYSENNYQVGPESVGAAPGPACFDRGGDQATITDAYLLMGYFDPATFFGGRLQISADKANTAVSVNISTPAGLELDEALQKLDNAYHQKIANEIKAQDLDSDTVLMAFGGAGPMSACKVAELSDLKTIVIPNASPVFCAFGLGFSDVSHRYEIALGENTDGVLEEIEAKAAREIFAEGFDIDSCEVQKNLVWDEGKETLQASFDGAIPDFGNKTNPRLRLRVVKRLTRFPLNETTNLKTDTPIPHTHRTCLLTDGSRNNIPVYLLDELTPGMGASGPALVEDDYSTCRIIEGWEFLINENKDIVITRK